LEQVQGIKLRSGKIRDSDTCGIVTAVDKFDLEFSF